MSSYVFFAKNDRFNNRQSGHGPCHKSLSNQSFSIFLFTNLLKSLPLRVVSLIRSDKKVIHFRLRLHDAAVNVLLYAVCRNHSQLQGLARLVGVRYNFSIKNINLGAETYNFYPVSAPEFVYFWYFIFNLGAETDVFTIVSALEFDNY